MTRSAIRLLAAAAISIGAVGGASASAPPSDYPFHIPHITGYVFHPWCYDGTGNEAGVPICGYDSYRQCVENAGTCVINPYYDWPESPSSQPEIRHHHPAR